MRKLWAVICVLMLMCECANAESVVYVTASKLNGRDEAAFDAHVESHFYRGEALDVVGYSGDWVEVVGGETGTVFVHSSYVINTEVIPVDNTAYTVTSKGRVHVRKLPNGSHARWVYNGDVLVATWLTDGWAFVGNGWVSMKYLEARIHGNEENACHE